MVIGLTLSGGARHSNQEPLLLSPGRSIGIPKSKSPTLFQKIHKKMLFIMGNFFQCVEMKVENVLLLMLRTFYHVSCILMAA